MSRSMRVRGTGLVVASLLAVGVVAPAAPAGAVDGDGTLEVMGESVEPSTDTSFHFDEAEVAAAEEVAESADALAPPEQEAAESLVEYSETAGSGTVDPESVDVLSLDDGNILVATTDATDISGVAVDIEGGEVSAEVATDPSGIQIESAGPGMAGTWGSVVGGDYTLTVRGLGDGNFTWNRRRYNDSASPYYVYWYRRDGDAYPYSRSGPDAKVKTLRVQTFPFDNTAEEAEASWSDSKPRLASWISRAPAIGFTGDCDGSPITPSVNVPGGSISASFKDCDEYDVWRNAAKPGSYWIEMDQGYFIHNGSRSAGFVMSWRARKRHPETGRTLLSGSMHDLNKVVFTIPFGEGERATCTQTDASRTCS